MKLQPPLQLATLIRRYKRFLADVEVLDGSVTTLHCPNTGSMRHCAQPGSRIWYSRATNSARKYPCTWEIVEVEGGHLAGINTGRANTLVCEALDAGVIGALRGYRCLKREVRYGSENSRIDFLLSQHPDRPGQACYVEVKNVTLGLGNGLGAFPDAVTERGLKHLRELIQMRAQGARAVLLFCVQHNGIERVVPADHIDPVYGQMLREAERAGVEILASGADLSPHAITLCRELPVLLD